MKYDRAVLGEAAYPKSPARRYASTLAEGIYRDLDRPNDPHYIIVNPVGGFFSPNVSQRYPILAVGSSGCGPISGDTLGRWELLPKGFVITASWIVD